MFQPGGPTLLELARQALSSTPRGYDLLAPKFDRTPFRTPQWIVQEVLRRLDPVPTALDLCCGTGAGMLGLRPICRDLLVGLDFSPGMLAQCRRTLAETETTDTTTPRLAWVQGDALALPFRATFDLIVCFGAHGHILEADEPRFVDQVARALKPGGRFVCVTTSRPSPWSLVYWLALGFNAAMRVRNAMIRPPFIMYYMTFLLPDVERLFTHRGFDVKLHRGWFGPELAKLICVEAVRR